MPIHGNMDQSNCCVRGIVGPNLKAHIHFAPLLANCQLPNAMLPPSASQPLKYDMTPHNCKHIPETVHKYDKVADEGFWFFFSFHQSDGQAVLAGKGAAANTVPPPPRAFTSILFITAQHR